MVKKKIISVTVFAERWNPEPICPKCLRQEASDESAYEPFHAIHLENTDLLFMTCKTCGYNWLMETADAK